MGVKTSFSNLCTALKTVLSNKLDKSGGTLTGALTAQNVNINGVEIFNNIYTKKNLGVIGVGAWYKDLDSKYKDGTYHRMWRIRFGSNTEFVGTIKVNLKSSRNSDWAATNAMGSMSKTINCGYQFSSIYNNVGYYDSLGYLTERDFRISELIRNDTANAWEILIWQNHLKGDNVPVIMLEFFGTAAPSVSLQPVELTQMISYTAPKASPTGGDKVVNFADTPVFETPYGKEVATTDVATQSLNGLMSKDDKKKIDDMVSTADEIATIVNAYGSKNLVDYSLIPNSTGGGVTRKNNGDGSITYSGTSTLTTTTYLPLMAGQSLGTGTYIFTPNPTTTASYTYQMYKNGSYWKNFAVTQPIEITEAGKYSIGLALNSKATISNTFKPMLRYAEIKDDTFVPYAMTNRELTEKVIGVGWVTTENLRYRKTGSIIALQGTVIPSSSAMSITLGTLPEDCRPSQNINIAQAGTDTPSRQIIVQTDGNVVLLFSSNCTASHSYAYNGIFIP